MRVVLEKRAVLGSELPDCSLICRDGSTPACRTVRAAASPWLLDIEHLHQLLEVGQVGLAGDAVSLTCNICGKARHRAGSRVAVARGEQEAPDVQSCDHCPAQCRDGKELRKHLLTEHKGEKVWPCNQGEKAFKSPGSLKVHSQARLYPCTAGPGHDGCGCAAGPSAPAAARPRRPPCPPPGRRGPPPARASAPPPRPSPPWPLVCDW